MVTLAQASAAYRAALARSEFPETGAPVLVATRPLTMQEMLERGGRMAWDTNLDDLGELMAQGDVVSDGDLAVLQELVDDASEVIEIAKTAENEAANICIGRGARNDVIIADPIISSLHAHVIVGPDRWQLVDQGSSNGTFVNGRRLVRSEPIRLKEGDCVRFGNRAFYFLSGARFLDFLELRG